MKSINSPFFFILLFFFSFDSYKKPNHENEPVVSKEELLTHRPWRLVSYGRDFNNNGLIDLVEEQISNCQADNEYTFAPDGSGVVDEKSIICEGNYPQSSFKWSFVNQQTELDFVFGRSVISKLTEDSMVLGDKINTPGRLVFFYKH